MVPGQCLPQSMASMVLDVAAEDQICPLFLHAFQLQRGVSKELGLYLLFLLM